MRFDDDELAERLRRLDPAITPQNTPLTAAQLAIRDRITGATAIPSKRLSYRRPLWWSAGIPALATFMVTLVVLFSFNPTPKAVALTPAPLTFTNTGQSAVELLAAAKHALEERSPVKAERATTSTGWYLQVEHQDATSTVVISPQVTTMRWRPDQSGEVLVVAGVPYWADGAQQPIPSADYVPPGTVISQMTVPAGEWGAPTVDPPGATIAEMTEWLQAMGLPVDADAADLIDTINLAMSYWTLTNQQHATLLHLLLSREDIEVVGTGLDRAGREVTAVAADSGRFAGTRRILLISSDTGRIVAEEVVRTTPDGDLPAGSVISYTLWGLPTK